MYRQMKSRTMLLIVLALLMVGLATLALAGETSSLTVPAMKVEPLSPEVRLANVQRAMTANNIAFQATVSLGDDGRIMVRVIPIDTLAK